MDLFEGGRNGEHYKRFKRYPTEGMFKIHNESFMDAVGNDFESFDFSRRVYNKTGYIDLKVCFNNKGFFILAPKGLYFEDEKHELEAIGLGVEVGFHENAVDGYKILTPIFNGNKMKLPQQYALGTYFVLDLLLIERFWNWLGAIHKVLKHSSISNDGFDGPLRLKVIH